MNNLTNYEENFEVSLFKDMSNIELFNASQETEPIEKLVDKNFIIEAIIPEISAFPIEISKDVFSETEFKNVLKIILITDKGVYHSFSKTFNRALANIINIFGSEVSKNTLNLTTKMADKKVRYVLKIVEDKKTK